MTRIDVGNGEKKSQEFVIGQIYQSVKNIEARLDNMNSYGCEYGRVVKKEIDRHQTQHRTFYTIAGIIAGVIAWIMSNLK